MSEIDAAELARMRVDTLEAKAKCGWHINVKPDAVLSLIDALEKAQEERDENKWCKSKLIGMRAERDAARALLKEIHDNAYPGKAFAARIQAELEK